MVVPIRVTAKPACVMAGLGPATQVFTVHRHQINPADKSFHSGLLATIRRTFQALGQCLIFFSR
jgi:hypothetical protein